MMALSKPAICCLNIQTLKLSPKYTSLYKAICLRHFIIIDGQLIDFISG